MSMDHKAYPLDYEAFESELAPLLSSAIQSGDIDELRTQYRAQIAAYWKAITKMTDMSVDAGIYSTSTGQFIAYERGELAREWQRLSQLPLSRLVGEITEG